MSDAVEKIYYAIDAYYSFQEDKLYTIVKEYNPENDTYRKITKVIPSPKINIKVADFTKKVQYLVQYNKTESIEIGYKQYFMLKKQLESLYKGKPVKQSNLQKQFPDLLSFKKEIYDDYKVETQFLQKEIFDYSVNYIPAIDIAFWDIEVLTDDSEFPKASEAKYPINAIAIYYRKDDRVDFYCVLDKVRHKDKKRLLSEIVKKVEENITKFNILNIYFFDNESDLIINYLKNIKNVDVLVGWNSLTFDTLYIYNRCEQLGLSRYFTLTFGKLFEILNVVDSKDGMMASTYYTTKILSLDYIMLIKFFSAKKYPSHRLDYIAKAILNESDKSNELNQKVDVGNINKAYYNDLPTFALYNINDVILNKKIDDIVQFVSILFRFKSRLHGFTASLMSINNILDSYIALKAKENGLACISKIKTGTFYKDKIWYIYRTVNNLSDARIESINKIREENKTFSIFIDSNEVLSEDSGILSDSFIDEIPDEIQLSKLQVPFAWNEDKYPGAYVKKPKKGIYRNVVDFDASLPPWEKIYIKRDNKIHCYHIGSYKKETGDLVLSWDNMNNVCWSKVYDRIQHEWCGKLIKFTTRCGVTGTVTANHSIYGSIDGTDTYRILDASKFNINDMILITPDIINNSNQSTKVMLDIIVDIEYIDYNGYVFDISVDPTERFICGAGLCAKNTSMYPTAIYITNNSVDTWIYQVPENVALKWIYERDDFINYVKNNPISMKIYDVRNDNFVELKNMDIIAFFEKMYKNEMILTDVGAVFIPAHIKEGFSRKVIIEPIQDRQTTRVEMDKLTKEFALTSDHPDIIYLDVTQKVLKILANSFYGYLGYSKSRMFNIILASAITVTSQMQIRYVANNCDKMVYDVSNNTKI